jgi:hypothetical protein
MAKAVSSPPTTKPAPDIMSMMLEDAESPISSPGDLKQAVKFADEMQSLEARMAALMDEHKRCAERHSQIQLNLLPDIMASIGVKKFDLESGFFVEIKDVTRGTIPTLNQIEAADEMDRGLLIERRNAALKWLKANGAESIIKNQVVAEFGKGQDADAMRLFKRIQEEGYKVKKDEDINFMTLNSYLKEALKNGKPVPVDAFALFVGKKAEMKQAKVKK